MVSFSHNGSEITAWMGYSFQTKSTKSKAKQHLTSSCKSLDWHKDTGIVRQLTKTTIFIATPMKKHIQQFILLKGVFVNLLTEKLWV